jgi:hypothetical protein
VVVEYEEACCEFLNSPVQLYRLESRGTLCDSPRFPARLGEQTDAITYVVTAIDLLQPTLLLPGSQH